MIAGIGNFWGTSLLPYHCYASTCYIRVFSSSKKTSRSHPTSPRSHVTPWGCERFCLASTTSRHPCRWNLGWECHGWPEKSSWMLTSVMVSTLIQSRSNTQEIWSSIVFQVAVICHLWCGHDDCRGRGCGVSSPTRAEPVGRFMVLSPAATILHQANVHPNAVSHNVGHFAHQKFALSHLNLWGAPQEQQKRRVWSQDVMSYIAWHVASNQANHNPTMKV